jgi:hypothetical protein
MFPCYLFLSLPWRLILLEKCSRICFTLPRLRFMSNWKLRSSLIRGSQDVVMVIPHKATERWAFGRAFSTFRMEIIEIFLLLESSSL